MARIQRKNNVNSTSSRGTVKLVTKNGTEIIFHNKDNHTARNGIDPDLECIFICKTSGLPSNFQSQIKPIIPPSSVHILNRTQDNNAPVLEYIRVFVSTLEMFPVSYKIRGGFGMRLLVFIALVGVGEARPAQSLISKGDEACIPVNLLSMLPCWITFQCILWQTVITRRSRVSQIVLLAFELFVGLALSPALYEIGTGGLLLGIGVLLLLCSKLLVPVDAHHALSNIPPMMMIKRCLRCNRTDCDGNCGQGGSSGGNDEVV